MKQKKLRRGCALLLSLALLLSMTLPALAADGDADPDTPVPPEGDSTTEVTVTVNLSASVISLVLEDQYTRTETLTADVLAVQKVGEAEPAPISVKGAKVEWKTDSNTVGLNKTQSTVGDDNTASNVITAVAEGNAEITVQVTVTVDGQDYSGTAKCAVTVEKKEANIPVTGITLNKDTMELAVGSTETLTATVSPSDATDKTVEWSTNGPGIATVDDKGVVTGVAQGTTTIIAKAGDKEASCTVTVTPTNVPVTSVSLSPVNLPYFTNSIKKQTLTATVVPNKATNQRVTWTSSNPDVVKVTWDEANSGIAILEAGETAGSVEITVTTEDGGYTATCRNVQVSGIELEPLTESVQAGRTVTLRYTQYGEVTSMSSNLTWSSSNQSVATVSTQGRLTARSQGTTFITVSKGGYTSQPLEVRVVENNVNLITGSISSADSYDFSDILSALNSVSYDMTEYGLDYLANLQVATAQGVLYYSYVSPDDHGFGVGGTEKYYYTPRTGQRALKDVTFVPKSDFTGTATITYIGYNTRGDSYSGSIRLDISSPGDVTYTVGMNNYVNFQFSDFNTVCRERTTRELSYVTFDLPSSSRGTLYYDYHGQTTYAELVSQNTRYYHNRSPYLDNVSFVPPEDFTGSVRITYHAVDTTGVGYSGTVTVNVTNRDASTSGTVNYSAGQGTRVAFSRSDFYDACRSALGETLDYVYFTLPNSSVGTLYHNYTNTTSRTMVSANTRYYYSPRTGQLALRDVSFVPASNDLDTVSIEFTGYSTAGRRFTGTVVIQYARSAGQGAITYSAMAGQAALFNAADFNELCVDLSNKTLNYVVFDSLPSTREGTLYSSYTNISSTGSKVTSTSRIYRSNLSRVAFVPASTAGSEVYIGFTGYGDDGTKLFTGDVRITVQNASALTVRYSAYSGRPVAFRASDFNSASLAATGSNLNYVRFQLPTSNWGVLYYDYDASKSSNTRVSTGANYYRSSSNTGTRLVDNVAFAAGTSYLGNVEFAYTGVAANNVQFTGTVVVTVLSRQPQEISYSANSLPVSLQATDFYRNCNAVLDDEFSYIQFTTLPDSSQGTLYWGYSTPGTGTRVTTGTSYYYSSGSPRMNQLSFVPKAGYQGRVSFTYDAYSVKGEHLPGTVIITVTSQTYSNNFSDLWDYSWAVPSIEFLYQGGVVNGIGGSLYGPSQNIKRGDFALMLCRSFGFNTGSVYSFADVPADSYYAWAIATAKDMGIVEGNSGQFRPEGFLSRQDAMVMLQRALRAAGRSVPSGSSTNLYAYSDGWQVSGYAQEAVGSMIALGMMQGSNGAIRPLDPINRAEMAVVMHRVMTQ